MECLATGVGALAMSSSESGTVIGGKEKDAMVIVKIYC
jgi:hypothetical protein